MLALVSFYFIELTVFSFETFHEARAVKRVQYCCNIDVSSKAQRTKGQKIVHRNSHSILP